MATPAPALKTKLFYPTDQKDDVLQNLARHELLTTNQLVYLIYGPLEGTELENAQARTRSTTLVLESDHLIASTSFRPENFKGKGKYPKAFWLLEKGREYAAEHWPATDPKAHGEERSELNVLHDLRRSDTRIALYEFADKQGIDISCQKNDLVHEIKPDDLLKFRKTKLSHFFLEEERVKKGFQDLYDKLLPYKILRGTRQFTSQWNFSHYTLIVPLRSKRALENVLVHFRGGCNCFDPNARLLHAGGPFKLISDHIWYTTHDALIHQTDEKIFFTTSDATPHSLFEVIR